MPAASERCSWMVERSATRPDCGKHGEEAIEDDSRRDGQQRIVIHPLAFQSALKSARGTSRSTHNTCIFLRGVLKRTGRRFRVLGGRPHSGSDETRRPLAHPPADGRHVARRDGADQQGHEGPGAA